MTILHSKLARSAALLFGALGLSLTQSSIAVPNYVSYFFFKNESNVSIDLCFVGHKSSSARPAGSNHPAKTGNCWSLHKGSEKEIEVLSPLPGCPSDTVCFLFYANHHSDDQAGAVKMEFTQSGGAEGFNYTASPTSNKYFTVDKTSVNKITPPLTLTFNPT